MLTVIFSLGKFFYKPERSCNDNILLKFYGCIKHAAIKSWRRTSAASEKPVYWLHNAYDKYEPSFVNDVGKVLKVHFQFQNILIKLKKNK